MGTGDVAEKLLFAHELTHALQDQSLRLDRRFKSLRDDGDRALALQCLLEGEATVVMVRVALRDLPGADEAVEEALAPLRPEPSRRRTSRRTCRTISSSSSSFPTSRGRLTSGAP